MHVDDEEQIKLSLHVPKPVTPQMQKKSISLNTIEN